MEVQLRRLDDRYTLLDRLGSGGMAVVWRARDEVLGRTVAIKLLAGRYAGDAAYRSRIRDEARAAATFSDPHIAQVYDYGEAWQDGLPVPYVVMELVHGVTLQQRARHSLLDPREICRIGAQVAAALAAAHAHGLVHRDIKPANVMVTADGVKVVDFGLAAAAGPAEPEEELLGTPAYLAPERLTGDAVEPASDVYALGVLLYRLLAGESPWTADTTTQMLTAHVTLEPVPLPPLPGVDPAIAGLVDRCLRKDPLERPSAAEVARTLGEGPAVRPQTPPMAVAASRQGGKLLAVAVAAVLVAVGTTWALLPRGAQGGDVPASALPTAASARPSPTPKRPAVTEAAPTRTVSGTTTTAATTSPPTTSAPAQHTTTTASPSPSRPPAATATFRSTGGFVTARCGSTGRVTLVAWAAVEPYKVERVNPGPAATAGVVFAHGASRIRMRVTCVAGIPVVATTRP
ncbi:serine/threonine-protein kinase [Actinoplanes sp. NPDC051475]|uniref:serine/threonine-protein kinase n=1 Tax=Actinoplanes sp. NPDC051475 TaxID=3157225 RepID=UPI00344C4BF8